MTVSCPNGHSSTTSDYCDQCGTRLDVTAPALGSAQPTEVLPAADDPETAATATADPCPACRAPRSGGDRYCEACGYDFVGGVPALAADPAGAAGENDETQVAVEAAPPLWEAVVSADRRRFERYADTTLAFPAHSPQRRFALDQAQVQIGRSRSGLGVATPDIDLVGAFEDPAISRLHAVFVRQVDGSFAVVDLDSTNGTSINDDPRRIKEHVPVALADGDRVNLGAWTTVTIRRREAP